MTSTDVFSYLTVPESDDYRAILGIFAGTFFAELTPDDVAARLAADGTPMPGDTVASRLESLRAWGNLEVSASVGAVSTVADYYRRRNRYLITRVGQEVHELVEGVLAQVDDVRDVSLGRLDALATALESLLALDAATADPERLADAVRAVFDPHRAFSAEITQFFAAINQWQSRFDLDETEFAFFSEVLVGYVGERLEALERKARPIAALLDAVAPSVPVIVERARDGLAARVADAGITGVRVRAGHGSTVEDWDNLAAWFRGSRGSPSRVATLGRDAVNAVRTLTQNLTRLSRTGLGASSRRADYLRLAAMFHAADPGEAPALAVAAFGLFGCRHLGAAAGDDTDPVPPTTSWWDAPPARVPVSLRERGDTANRGPAARVVDRSAQREHLLSRRREEERRAAAARAEIRTVTGPDGAVPDGAQLSDPGLRELQRLLAPAIAALGADRSKGEAELGGLRCVVERSAGRDTTLCTPAGRLRLQDLQVAVMEL
ncbi:MAG: TIGR02677 family protein [Pseudonocardiaceae bacterium]|nr:TIGR02677 family protein [Pseudonocardiaceae bacterium]